MVGNARPEYAMQCREQPALLWLQRRPVVDGTSGWLSHAALPDLQAGLGIGLQRPQGRARHQGLFRETTSVSGRARGRYLVNAPDPDDARVYGFQRRPMRQPAR